ncbi:SecY-interacting protein [Sansalvadorimonas verongulae]|uniref:SecY-interacting protein n=1 Tax=Sansalvadorimonas verongulae TaxID=2172824 RepID=UPI0012BC644F|nr:SecY-interacting protein [Sansalvadorimonas verongulae]MTI14571.1 SecY-interacting protein [Sansalvadorimonas verongulae]
MTESTNAVQLALQQFHNNYLNQYKQIHGCLPVCEKDEQWLSPCEQAHPDSELTYWQPVTGSPSLDFKGLESAMGLSIHPDVSTYFTAFFSGHIPARCTDGDLELLQIWNRDDFDRLQENLIGHLMMKKKKRQEPTIFFAVTDNDEIILSVVNATGEVWAERVGQNPHRKLANSLPEFLNTLEVPPV